MKKIVLYQLEAEAITKIHSFAGKPYIENLGYAFLLRNYRSDLGKWQTSDPLGYPDGWNNFSYCNNRVILGIDLYGATFWSDLDDFFGAVGDFITDNTLTNGVSDYWNAMTKGLEEGSKDPSWLKDIAADYSFGRDPVEGESSSFLSLTTENPAFQFISAYIPTMDLTAVIHDEIANTLINSGYDYNPTSPETMIPSWLMALYLNLEQTGSSILDILYDFSNWISE